MVVVNITPVLDSTIVDLSYDRTVDRRTVHRWALSEVFLTDVQRAGANRFFAAAQLPTSHVYYCDHTAPASVVDSLLLLECCRQAATWTAHEHLAVSHGSTFLVANWALQLVGADWPTNGEQPGRLGLDLVVTPSHTRGEVTRGAEFDMRLYLDGLFIGTTSIAARYIPADEATAVRAYHRKTPPPMSTSLPSVPIGTAVSPREVGRGDPNNVVLYNPMLDGNRIRATLATRAAHRSFYDHPQDHYTAMILLEAARQMAFLSTESSGGSSAIAAGVSGFEAQFALFAELDSPVIVNAAHATLGTDAGEKAVVPVMFEQGDSALAEATVTMSRRHPGPARWAQP